MSNFLYLSPDIVVPKRVVAALVKIKIQGTIALIFFDGVKVPYPEYPTLEETYNKEFSDSMVKISEHSYVNPELVSSIAKKPLEKVRVYFKSVCYLESEANIENTLKILNREITLDELQKGETKNESTNHSDA